MYQSQNNDNDMVSVITPLYLSANCQWFVSEEWQSCQKGWQRGI